MVNRFFFDWDIAGNPSYSLKSIKYQIKLQNDPFSMSDITILQPTVILETYKILFLYC